MKALSTLLIRTRKTSYQNRKIRLLHEIKRRSWLTHDSNHGFEKEQEDKGTVALGVTDAGDTRQCVNPGFLFR
ncbi:hypothetical protein CCUS01_10163 [Colletotrichum cuscutae]|uniref:Uncharacterized protein n=1 Tax=Colletotrichum cuscutae TaxID=1209917 RepID=A0AAI9UFQ4_9PEZI|nr:hypothetical protein CCUS01_10163 [Colletotrichum cuscutae]